jgi:hypothetical protein
MLLVYGSHTIALYSIVDLTNDKMLNDLKLENLQLRRTSLRLVFLYKVVEGLVPAINPSEFLVKSKPKRKIKPKHFDNFDFESVNIHVVYRYRR